MTREQREGEKQKHFFGRKRETDRVEIVKIKIESREATDVAAAAVVVAAAVFVVVVAPAAVTVVATLTRNERLKKSFSGTQNLGKPGGSAWQLS